MTKYLQVKDWGNFQHYKDRSPAWIKLHKNLLDDFEFQCLPLASRALAPMLWLIASESQEGIIEYNIKKLSFRLRVSEQEMESALEPLLSGGFLECYQGASSPLAEVYSNGSLEKRREEKEERRTLGDRNPKVTLQDLNISHIADWLKEKRSDGKYVNHDEKQVLEKFKNYCQAKGKRYSDYVAAYRNAFDWESCQPPVVKFKPIRPNLMEMK